MGWFALNDYAAAVTDAARATLRLVVGEREQEFSVHRQRGRRALEFRMPSEPADTLTLEIDAAQAGVRHMCWSLRAVQRAEVGR